MNIHKRLQLSYIFYYLAPAIQQPPKQTLEIEM